MQVTLKRVYDDPASSDGYRVLVDRLWPRGISKKQARVDEWVKEIAPSEELRKWFDHERERWAEFRRRYLTELKGHRTELEDLLARAKGGKLTLVFAARDEKHNQAEVIRQYLNLLEK